MRRSRGFTLAEILVGMMLQAMFILALCGAFYMLVSFGSGTQQILTARERGQRVIAYVDNRIQNAGLGMWKLGSWEEYRDAFASFVTTGASNPLALDSGYLRLPVAITDLDNGDPAEADFKAARTNQTFTDPSTGHTIQYGNVLTLLYTRRVEATDNRNFVIVNESSVDVSPDAYIEKYRFITGGKEYTPESFNDRTSINSYAAMVGAGEPILITSETTDEGIIGLEPLCTAPTSSDPVIISGDELLPNIKCERMFTGLDTTAGERNFRFQTLDGDSWNVKRQSHEIGILEIYMELDTANNVFDLYVLASGGTDGRTHERPASWPERARPSKSNWSKSDYRFHVLYVSRASWKLKNIPNGFSWN